MQRFTPLFIDAARPCRHSPGDRWFVDQTYVKVASRWIYLYRAIDQFGQVIDVLAAQKRDLAAARRFFTQALEQAPRPTEVTTDRAPAYFRILDELLPAALHVFDQYATDEIVNRKHSARWDRFSDSFLSPGGSDLKRRSAAEVKVERTAGRTTLTSARTGVASGGGGRGSTPSRRVGQGAVSPAAPRCPVRD